MRHTRLRIAATTFMVLVAITVPTILFIRSQAAQTTGQTDGSSQRVLIEKNQIVEPLLVFESSSRTPTLVEEKTSAQPPRFTSAIQAFERGEAKGQSFSAEVQVETVAPLREGGTTMRKATYLIYRDNEGRTRRDLTSDYRPRISVINDPVAGFTYVMEHGTSTVRKMVFSNESQPQPTLIRPNTGETAPGFVNLEPRNSKLGTTTVKSEPPASIKKEQLGQREIQGVLTDGTRLVQTIRLGALGSENPINITTEEWYSPELQTMVAITVSDPRFGQSEYRLVNIVRVEPSSSLFAIPQGYKIKDQ